LTEAETVGVCEDYERSEGELGSFFGEKRGEFQRMRDQKRDSQR